jgi:putative flippase GtrA
MQWILPVFRRQAGLAHKAALYFVVGGCAAIVDLSVFHFASGRGISTPVAAVASFLVAVLVNYTLSSLIVFQTSFSLGYAASFLAGASAGLVMNSGLTVALAELGEMDPTLAKAIAIGATFVLNFWINAFIVFRSPTG